ncbi:MAG: heme-binding protein [Rhizobiaceae bacterium]|nr:heme-binding protein [Rhizobiaceae bacterium]
MAVLTLHIANAIVADALAKGEEMKLRPLAVALLDAGGHLKAFQRQDGTSIMRPEIALGKAFGALALGTGSRALHGMAAERPHFIEGLVAASGGRIIPVPGGVLITVASGEIVGAVGVTGDTSDNDEACAAYAIAKAGFTPKG